MVIYRTGDGQPGYHQAAELDEAVKFVERLRNGEGVDSARIFRMEEVNFDFRPYFKVEIGPSGAAFEEPAPVAPAPAADVVPAPSPEAPVAPIPESAAPAADVASDDVWGDLGGDDEPASLVDQAASFIADDDDEPAGEGTGNGEHADEGVGVRRGLFGR
jgi:hypothetical protein